VTEAQGLGKLGRRRRRYVARLHVLWGAAMEIQSMRFGRIRIMFNGGYNITPCGMEAQRQPSATRKQV